MDRAGLEDILRKLHDVTIAVVGDFFLDRYLVIESSLAERSVETGLTAHQVVARRLTPGAAGTVVSNLKALGVGDVVCFGVIGADGEGHELRNALRRIGATTRYCLIESKDRFTPCYTKPMLRESGVEREMERIDIKNRKPVPEAIQIEMLQRVTEMLPKIDGVVIADQVQERDFGVVSDYVRDALCTLSAANPGKVFLADSRARIGEYRSVMTKPNVYEAVDAIMGDARVDSLAGNVRQFSLSEARLCGAKLRQRTGAPVFMTAQHDGIFLFHDSHEHVQALRVEREIDPVGAGDSCTAGIVSALCAGASLADAALLGNIAASITVQKIGETGTASPAEVLARFEQYTNRPVLGRQNGV